MIKVEVKNLEGKKVEDLQLSDDVFGLQVKDEILHNVFVAGYANKREVLAHTKNRAERAGSGIKPWKQKGTGRARVGSVRSPIWRKGGITFGPRNERNFSKKVNRKEKRLAVKMALSGKISDGQISVVEKLILDENKTKIMAKALENLGLKGKMLMAYLPDEKKAALASRNIQGVQNILADNLNVFDILSNKYLVLSKEAVKMIEKKYSKKGDERQGS